MDCSTPGFPVHHLPDFAQTHVYWVSDAIQPPHPLSVPSSPAFIFSGIRVFSDESALHIRCPKYWSFSIGASNEHLGLISFRIDWFDLLAVQGNLKSLFHHHSSKASILWHAGCFIVKLSHPYMKNHNFVGKVMSLLFNTLSRFVIAFLQQANIFLYHGYSHHPQWFWSPRK